MTKLSFIGEEALRVLRRPRGPRVEALRLSLAGLCEAHWAEMRGPEPNSRLGKALWAVPPHLADLFVHLYGVGDARLAAILDHLRPEQALALLVLTEIERGEAEGARSAYTAMRLFASPSARTAHVGATLAGRGGQQAPDAWLRHAHRPAVWRAVVGLAMQAGRWETNAVLAALRAVAQAQTRARAAERADDPPLRRILDMLSELNVIVLRADEEGFVFALRGEEQPPVSRRQLAEMLAEGQEAQ
jgi:hypothetical protein